MKLVEGTTYKLTHTQCPDVHAFVTCLGEQTHMSIYNTHDDYYRNTKDLESVLNKNGFKVEEIQLSRGVKNEKVPN